MRKHPQTETADVEQAYVMPGRRVDCMLDNRLQAAVVMGLAGSPSTILEGDRPLVVAAVRKMDHAAVQARGRQVLDSGRDSRDGRAGWGRIGSVHILQSMKDHIDCNVTGVGHMDSLRQVRWYKGCTRRCNGHAGLRLPWCG